MTSANDVTKTESDRDVLFERYLENLRAADPEVVPHWIDGQEVREGEVIWREDPLRPEKRVSGCHDAPLALVETALAAARRSARGWDDLGHVERANRLRPALDLLDEERLARIAATISLEIGKCRAESFAEAEEVGALIDVYSKFAIEEGAFEDSLAPRNPDARSSSLLRPFGVFGVIAPFNYPTVQGVGAAVAALLMGNTVVLKPAHLGPRSAHEFIELIRECDLPAGVLNMVQGGDEAGRALVSGDVDGIAFTGSYAAGMSIFEAMQSGPYVRPVITEMGGKNPVVVTESADLERAADGVARSAFTLSGQRCNACSRAIVSSAVHDEFVELLAQRAAEFKIGDAIDKEMELGPLVESSATERFERVLEEARRDGRVAAGGERVSEFGYAVQPTVVVDLPKGHRLERDEHFMPLITVTAVDSFEEAIAEANDTDLGLAAGIYTGEKAEAEEYLKRIDAGCVDVNVPRHGTTGFWPGAQTFGGWKGSGSTGKQAFGRWYLPQFARQRCQTIANDLDF